MEEIFDLNDKNFLFHENRALHDEIMTHIEVADNELRIVYGKIGEDDYYKPYSKVTVTYVFDFMENDYCLNIIKVKNKGRKEKISYNDPDKINELNNRHMVMYNFDIDLWGTMTLHFTIWNKKKEYNVELSFTPAIIKYQWEQ